ncbi:MAG: 50S ribosome-binding GTPase [Candidatus Pacearchaeota archaeon]|nr:50S ribosome-binding GTPase [Candidatus Pacearchaeota archaeon]
MPINAHPDFIYAEKEYLLAENLEDKLRAMEKMISLVPKHKGAENLRAQLKLRYKKLKEKITAEKKSKRGSRIGIKKEDMQAVIIGKTKTGKSSLISLITNAHPEIADYEFTTRVPIIGMMDYNGVSIQLIEVPAIESEYYDRGITNSADSVLILITDLNQIQEIEKKLDKSAGKRIIIFNKIDSLSESEKRKISATLSSKKYNFQLISTRTKEGTELLKEKLFQSFGKIRVYTKQPNEKQKAKKPIILFPDSIVKDVAEKILKGFSNKVKETRIWGPSSKYPGQVVGLQHKMKDLDVVKFKTR